MQAYKVWNELFSKKHIKEHYYEKVRSKTSVGLDKITPEKFESQIDENVDIISRKTNNQSYRFTRYKQLLFVKGPDKKPRSVSVPTVRDKLTLSILNEVIVKVFNNSCNTRLPQLIIREISDEISNFDSFIKLDITSFYSSINQEKLISIIKTKIRKKEILYLVKEAIQTDSLPYPVKDKIARHKKLNGIPEGLPISNSLANIYLSELDKKFNSIENIRYWRYVDDILILVQEKDLYKIESLARKEVSTLDLSFNEKTDSGKIVNGFEYLGYKISGSSITVRNSSVLKFEQAIEELIRTINKKNTDYIEWKLNNRITGFVLNNNKYGWAFFYSQISDISLLFHLDDFVRKILKRYKLDKVHCRKFVRTYHEITKALHTTKYIPNFDKYKIEDKLKVLVKIYGDEVKNLSHKDIESKFSYLMAKEVRDIERDIERFS
ncbi:MAG: hypothetical protein IJE16_07025 [Ruminococcus sp.]|nr:hypothetical protein [Ruminococcus sp.]